MAFTAKEIADLLGGRVEGDTGLVLSGLAKLQEARPGELSFLANPKYEKYLETTQAAAVIVALDQETPAGTYIRVEDPYTAFAQALHIFFPPENPPDLGIHPTAFIDPEATIGLDVRIGPLVAIGKGAVIGDRAVIYAGAIIGERVTIGEETTLRSGVSIRMGVKIGARVIIQDNAVIGSDGFGFAQTEGGEFEKVPQVGIVIIEDDVEIGAGCCIDRATLGATRIEKGVKLDNLIQVAHNVVIGAHTVIAAQTGISGSTTIGKHCMIGGQVGFVGHIEMGDGTLIGAQSGVSKSFPPGTKLFGTPARLINEELRIQAASGKLPDLVRQVAQLQREIDELRSKLEE